MALLARLFRANRRPSRAGSRWRNCASVSPAAASPLVVDVRGPDEFDGPLGHIEGARNIPLPDLAAHQGEIAAAKRPVVFVCLTDKRSAAAAAQLGASGLGDIAVLRGGMKAWREAE